MEHKVKLARQRQKDREPAGTIKYTNIFLFLGFKLEQFSDPLLNLIKI